MNYFSNINDLYKEILSGKQSSFGIFSDNISSKNEKDYYRYKFKLGNKSIFVYNIRNKCFKIDEIKFELNLNNMSIEVNKTYNYIVLHSIDELKRKVNEYRKNYKRLEELLKKMDIEKDFDN